VYGSAVILVTASAALFFTAPKPDAEPEASSGRPTVWLAPSFSAEGGSLGLVGDF